eukprot:UN30868
MDCLNKPNVFQAARVGNVEFLKLQMEFASPGEIDQKDSFGSTLLHLAAEKNNIDVVEYLIKQGMNTQIKDSSSGWIPLATSLYFGSLRCAALLFRSNSALPLDNDGENPLDLVPNNDTMTHTRTLKTLWSFGKSNNVQLGYDTRYVEVSEPRSIKKLKNNCFETSEVCCSSVGNSMVDKDGHVQVWGSAFNTINPKVLNKGFWRGRKVKKVLVCETHGCVLSSNGAVHVWSNYKREKDRRYLWSGVNYTQPHDINIHRVTKVLDIFIAPHRILFVTQGENLNHKNNYSSSHRKKFSIESQSKKEHPYDIGNHSLYLLGKSYTEDRIYSNPQPIFSNRFTVQGNIDLIGCSE